MTFSARPLSAPQVADPWIQLDGRLNAPVKSAQYPTALNTYHPAGIPDGRYRWPSSRAFDSVNHTYRQPQFMVCGVDYAVGIHPGVVLKDPATISLPGVTVDSATGSIIVNNANTTLDGYDFSLNNGWGVFPQNANCTISNSKFVVGSKANVPIWGQGGSVSNMTVLYCEIDGAFISTTPGTLINMEGAGVTCKYCLFQRGFGDMIDIGGGGQITLLYNVFKDNGSPATHPDCLQIGQGNYGPSTINFNFYYQIVDGNANTQPQGTQGYFLSGNTPWSLSGFQEIGWCTFLAQGTAGPNGVASMTEIDEPNFNPGATSAVHDCFVDQTAISPGFGFGDTLGMHLPDARYYNNVNVVDGTLLLGTG